MKRDYERYPKLSYSEIVAVVTGNVDFETVMCTYEKYINKICTEIFCKETGEKVYFIDEDMKQFIYLVMCSAIVKFKF